MASQNLTINNSDSESTESDIENCVPVSKKRRGEGLEWRKSRSFVGYGEAIILASGTRGHAEKSTATLTNNTEEIDTKDDINDEDDVEDDLTTHGGVEVKPGDPEVESTFALKFYPPVYIQRYNRVGGLLLEELEATSDRSPKTVLEVGSAECKMFIFLKSLPTVEKIIMMDIDKQNLQSHKMAVRPLLIEYVRKRETPLTVEVYSGCITKVDSRILSTQPKIYAVIAIEVIEHLDPDVGIGFENTLFSTLQPQIIIITTPNSEYNEVFGLKKGKFRHWDHRFEWTRGEFKDWCEKMCSKYPMYSFIIEGIGPGPPQFAHLGEVSQVAIFRKKADLAELSINEKDLAEVTTSSQNPVQEDHCYELISREEFPFFKDPATTEERILREFTSFVNMFIFTSDCRDQLEEDGLTETTYPLIYVKDLSNMPKTDDKTVRDVLEKGGFEFRAGDDGQEVVILPVPPREEEILSDDDEEDYMDGEGFLESNLGGNNVNVDVEMGQADENDVSSDEVWD